MNPRNQSKYKLEYSKNYDFSGSKIIELTGYSQEVSGLDPNSIYFFRVLEIKTIGLENIKILLKDITILYIGISLLY